MALLVLVELMVQYGLELQFNRMVILLKYTKTTFVDESAPYIDAAWLNSIGSVLEKLAAASSSKASVQSGETDGVYDITVDGYTSPPSLTDGDLFSVLFIPRESIQANSSIMWGEFSYPIYDASTGDAIRANQIISDVPALLIFDGSKFWFNGSGSCETKKIISSSAQASVTVEDNAEYRFTSDAFNSLSIGYPAGDFECWLSFTTAPTGSISLTFPSGTAFIGTVPSLENSTYYEISIKDKVAIISAGIPGDVNLSGGA